MRFEIITIFPGFFAGIFEHGIVRRAQADGLVSVKTHDLREFTHDRHRTVDDRPFGGGEGMVLKPEPLAEALESLGIGAKDKRIMADGGACSPTHAPKDLRMDGVPTSVKERSALDDTGNLEGATGTQDSDERASGVPTLSAERRGKDGAPNAETDEEKTARVVLLSAQGRSFTQAVARELAGIERVVLICGRYEGVDERINQLYCDMELSIGDYVLSGGELAAAVVVDAVMRLVPGVLGNDASGEFESFGVADADIASSESGVPRSQHGSGGLLDYPHYTRPAEFGGMRAPEVLMNGDHQQIRKWRREQQLRKTLKNRPDLLKGAALSDEDQRLLDAIAGESGA